MSAKSPVQKMESERTKILREIIDSHSYVRNDDIRKELQVRSGQQEKSYYPQKY